MIFLDTSFLVALSMEDDQNHSKAIIIAKEIEQGTFGETFISDYIFDETITFLLGLTKSVERTTKLGDPLKEASELILVGELTFASSWDTFKTQRTTRFSFTDCTTIHILKASNIKNIATFDAEFKTLKGISVVD